MSIYTSTIINLGLTDSPELRRAAYDALCGEPHTPDPFQGKLADAADLYAQIAEHIGILRGPATVFAPSTTIVKAFVARYRHQPCDLTSHDALIGFVSLHLTCPWESDAGAYAYQRNQAVAHYLAQRASVDQFESCNFINVYNCPNALHDHLNPQLVDAARRARLKADDARARARSEWLPTVIEALAQLP